MRLLQTIIIVIVVAGLGLGTALPVAAQSNTAVEQPQVPAQKDNGRGPWAEGKVKTIRGEVEAVGTDNITVGGKTILVVNETQFKVYGIGKDAGLSDIQVGMKIAVLAYEKEGKLFARQIMVISSRPSYGHHVGEVVAYNASNNITIKDKWNNLVTFKIGEEFKILPRGAVIDIGDRVTVITKGHRQNSERIAVGVVVQGEKTWRGYASASGNITAMNSDNITIGTTVLKYDAKTIFVMRGITGVPLGTDFGFPLLEKQATAFYSEQEGIKLARLVLIGVNVPEALKELNALEEKLKQED